MHPKIREFLRVRDGAYVRGDLGVIRSMNAELRRLGIKDEATLANPTGKPGRTRKPTPEDAPTERRPAGRPKLARCEHENVAERCETCNPELVAR